MKMFWSLFDYMLDMIVQPGLRNDPHGT